MPGQRTPAAVPLTGPISRRHAELLLLNSDGGSGVPVKDLRIRRVVPPASASLDSSPECVSAKPGFVESTPPEAASSPAAPTDDLERKPVLPRSKLVRDPASFGYRRLLPFLNQMAKNADEHVVGSRRDFDHTESSETVAAKTGGDLEMKDGCNNVNEEVNAATHDLAASKPLPARCGRSRFVHHATSFSYKRMLPFVMENEISSQEGSRVKIRRIAEESPLKSGVNDASASGYHHLAASEDSSKECNMAQIAILEEEKPTEADVSRDLNEKQLQSAVSKACSPDCSVKQPEASTLNQDLVASCNDEPTSDGNNVLASGQHQLVASRDSSMECNMVHTERMEDEKPPEADEDHGLDNQLEAAVPKSSPPECSPAEVQNVMHQEASTLKDPLASYEAESPSDGSDVLASGQHHLPVSDEAPEECSRDEVKIRVQDEPLKSVGSYVLDARKFQLVISEVSPLESSAAEVQKTIQEQALTSDGDKGNHLTPDKGEFLTKEQPEFFDAKESLTAELEDIVEFPEVPQHQSSDSGCPGVGLGSPTKTLVPLLNRQDSLVCQDVVASPDDRHLDAVMICRPSDYCAIDRYLSVEEMSGSVPCTQPGSSKAGILRPRDAHYLEKRLISPKKLSPRKGILKRHTRGCKGVCMCLDCSTFRLRADRAFEFSRKQMHEADDIICNLLKEVANLRSLVEKPAAQRESTQAACQRASRVEEVARDRCQQMFVDLNSHCRIPGPRVKFAQYVEEKLVPSPRNSKRRSPKL